MESWWDNTRILMDIPSGKLTWLLKMAIESDDLPIENGDFGWLIIVLWCFVSVYQRVLPRAQQGVSRMVFWWDSPHIPGFPNPEPTFGGCYKQI